MDKHGNIILCGCGDGDCDTCFPKPPGYVAEWQRREWKRELEKLSDELEELTARYIGDDAIFTDLQSSLVDLTVTMLRDVAFTKFGKTT